MDIVEHLRALADLQQQRDVYGRRMFVLDEAADRITALDVEVGSLRWVEGRLVEATGLLREWLDAWGRGGMLPVSGTRAFLNEAESTERGVVVPTPWVGAEPPCVHPLRLEAGACPSCGAHVRGSEPTEGPS